MKFEIGYERKKGENGDFELNTYASFCVSYINQIKDKLEFTVVEKEIEGKKILIYSMDMVNVKIKKDKNHIFRRQKKEQHIKPHKEEPIKTKKEGDS